MADKKRGQCAFGQDTQAQKCTYPVVNHAQDLYQLVTGKIDALQTRCLYRLQGAPCVLILPCKDPVKITGYHRNPSSSVVRTSKNCNQYREIPVL